ncbi:unnamed protein product [Heligmosomoides polygyrus]|uniref:HTH_48 domain-containing protein n=1 Tax=Heligmosomoides polygyrus TaxID=6339 RepID=A0A183GSS3_HELPZ|nr:unnamed protein product [Heligmosomoides polygyrus]
MLRWTAGVTRMDRVRNNAIRQKFGVALIAEKMREARLLWYGHILGGKEDSVRKIGLELDVSGRRPRGRPKQCWSDTLHTDMKVTGVHPDQAHDRENWRHDTRRADEAGQTLKKKKKRVATQFQPSLRALPVSPPPPRYRPGIRDSRMLHTRRALSQQFIMKSRSIYLLRE